MASIFYFFDTIYMLLLCAFVLLFIAFVILSGKQHNQWFRETRKIPEGANYLVIEGQELPNLTKEGFFRWLKINKKTNLYQCNLYVLAIMPILLLFLFFYPKISPSFCDTHDCIQGYPAVLGVGQLTYKTDTQTLIRDIR